MPDLSKMPAWARPGTPAKAGGSRLAGPWLVAVALLAACLGGLGAAYGFAQTNQGRPVLVLADTVLQGAVIEAGDLAVTEVADGNLPTVPASDRAAVVGTRALTTLPAGSLLAPGNYGQPRLADGLAQVQLRLGPAQLPDGPLPGGQALILLGLPGADDPDGLVWQSGARVVYPPVAQLDGSVVLDVAVAAADLARLTPYLLDRRVVVAISDG